MRGIVQPDMNRRSLRTLRRSALLVLAASFILIGASVRATNMIIGVIGDYGAASLGPEGAANEEAVARLVKGWQPDFIITVGDNNYPTNGADSIDLNIGRYYHEFIHPYRGAYGAGASSNRFYPSIGNHDWAMGWHGPGALNPYLNYFTLPGNERYYTHSHGNVELFAVSSNPMEPNGNTASSKQALWLSNALASSSATWRLVYFHESPYSSGYWHGSHTLESTNMAWPFREWGATAVLCGHDHLYERVQTNGMVYFINGTGGDRLDRFHFPFTAGSMVRYNARHGALRIDATETNLSFRFYNVAEKLLDLYRINAPARAVTQ